MLEIDLCKEHIIQLLEEDPQLLHEQWAIESLEDEKEVDELYELALDPDNWNLHDEEEGDGGQSESEGETTYNFVLDPSDEKFFAHVTVDNGEVIDCEVTGR